MSESAGLLNADKRSVEPSLASPLLRTIAVVVIILSVATVLCVVIFGAVVVARVGDVREAQEHLNEAAIQLPARYHVPYTAMTPAKDQGRRGTW